MVPLIPLNILFAMLNALFAYSIVMVMGRGSSGLLMTNVICLKTKQNPTSLQKQLYCLMKDENVAQFNTYRQASPFHTHIIPSCTNQIKHEMSKVLTSKNTTYQLTSFTHHCP